MFIRLRPDIIYRNYGSFGYITDNRNYEYKFLSDQHDDLGEMIVSESGMVFLEILDRRPKSLDQIVSELKNIFGEEDVESLRADASEFYIFLKQNGFLDIAPTFEECCHAKRVMSKSNVTIMNNNNMDISKLMNALSNMDKKDLEKGIAQLNNVLNSNDKQKIIEQLKNNMNK